MEKTVSTHKDKRKNERLAEVARKKKMRMIMFIVVAIIAVAFIVLAIIQANQPKKGFPFDYASQPTIGQANAPLKLLEFGDFKCPICKTFATTVYPQLKKDFIDTGKAQMSFMDFQIINGSMPAAIAAKSVFHQNKDAFWPYYDALYESQQDENTDWATSDFLTNLAKTKNIPVDYDLLKKDIEGNVYLDEVKKEYATAVKTKIDGTPALFMNGFEIELKSAMNYDQLKVILDKELLKLNAE